MNNRTTVRLWSALFLSGTMALSGCRENPLSVINPNNPDVARVYGTPKDVETIISKLFQQMWNAQQGNIGIGVQSMVMSLESHSGLANFGMGARAAIPRGPISNDLGNSDQDIIFNDFDKLTRNARSAANAIAAIDRFIAAGTTIGSQARDARARSFGYFVLGYGLGNLALLYDSSAVITPAVPSDEIPALSTAQTIMTTALAMLDSALVISASPAASNGANGWPIPGAWVSGSDLSLSRYQQVVHSYKARFRANFARTKAERLAVDWNAVVNDAVAGITTDFTVNANATTGWAATWVQQLAVDATWSQMTPFILGMADTAGSYDAWLATPINDRTPFLLRTPDKRFPAGATRAAQQAVSGSGRSGTPAGTILYYRNRPNGDDSPAASWGNWYYDNQRFWSILQAGGNGPVMAFSLAENEMLAAEGYIRTSRTALAVPLINKYRTRAGLAAILTGTSDPNAIVPGGTACVPRVPQPPTFTSTACGTVYEAMKWEKRLETAFTGYAQWFLDARGWGDLIVGTVLEWPVPWQELYARQNLTIYTTDKARAPAGTYGF
jgi:hypothetical protein